MTPEFQRLLKEIGMASPYSGTPSTADSDTLNREMRRLYPERHKQMETNALMEEIEHTAKQWQERLFESAGKACGHVGIRSPVIAGMLLELITSLEPCLNEKGKTRLREFWNRNA